MSVDGYKKKEKARAKGKEREKNKKAKETNKRQIDIKEAETLLADTECPTLVLVFLFPENKREVGEN